MFCICRDKRSGRGGVASLAETVSRSGAYTIAQDEKSGVVSGMPEQVIRLGAVGEIAPLERIMDWARQEYPKNISQR